MSVFETFRGMFAITYEGGSITITSNSENLLHEEDGGEHITLPGATSTTPVTYGATLSGTGNGGGLTGSFTYAGAVEKGGLYIGILVRDQASSQYYLLTTMRHGHHFNSGRGQDGQQGDDGQGGGATLTLQPTVGWNLLGATGSPACFMAGTAVRTPSGDVAVETLKPGDLVSLSDGRTAPVAWLGRQTISMVFADPLRVLPIRIRANALEEGIPARDLLLSSDHAVLIGDILVQAGALVNGISILRETDVPTVFTYYHVEVADHSLILAENTPAETFVDNVDRLNFDNWAEHQALVGDTAITEMEYPRAKSARQVPKAIRQRLAERAEATQAARRAAA
ncbi:Hint domain-containing protein [Acidocella sp.]|uniref:Hint domain-containing protein n=1 Tax=Acidocella sp. TaxID=50710 RepID=UPI002617DE51|nr:Hint domain-containing protein [Acidocella sp.]MDD2795079.1 Hint domain-containing protein [Acidocella sp.]